MDAKDRTSAANALVGWFNSQEIPPNEAARIMSKVLAKILVGSLRAPHAPETRQELDDAIDAIMLQLVHDMNDRLFATRR